MSTKNAALVLGAWMIMTAGCAKGANEPAGRELPFVASPDAGAIQDAGAVPIDEGPPAEQEDASMATFVGDPCSSGATEACACAGSTAMGERICLANAASPTGGAFSDCRGCPAPAPDAGMENGGASGMSGTGGMGGTSGASGMNAMSGGAGGVGGAGGAGGAAGSAGAPGCMCMDLLQCCRDDGSCGVGIDGLCI